MQGDLHRAKQKELQSGRLGVTVSGGVGGESRPGTYSHILTGVDDIKLDDVLIDTTLQERDDPYHNRIDKYSSPEVHEVASRRGT